jgi:predicted AlkP superfamily pyrophosphatase or phosphodiesterase
MFKGHHAAMSSNGQTWVRSLSLLSSNGHLRVRRLSREERSVKGERKNEAMCSICTPHRDVPAPDRHSAASSEHRVCKNLASVHLQTPISRRQLLKTVGGGLGAALTAGALDWVPAQSAAALPYVVIVVLDGARPEYFDVPGIPHVRSLIRNGTQYTNAFAGILESETPSGHASIGTGSEPRKTGIPSFWWATDENIQVSLFDPKKILAGDMEKILRRSGVPTLAGQVHARSRNAKVVALSGSKYYAADAIGGPDADTTMYFQSTANGYFSPTYIPGHAPPSGLLNASELVVKSTGLSPGVQNHLAMKLAVNTFQRMRQQVTLINLPEFDWPLGHVDGGPRDPKGVQTLMRGFDRDLAMLRSAYRQAGVLDRTLFVLMADHGMMPLRSKVSQADITSAVSKAGITLVSQAYTSGTFLWLKDESRAPVAARNIANLRNPHIQAVYVRAKSAKGFGYVRVSSSKLLRAGQTETANQYLLNSFNGPNAPDVVVVFTEGVGCEPGGQANWKADHGGTSWQAQHIPLILSGPGVRSGKSSSYPARLIDVAPTVLQLMGGSYARMQGLPLADAMTAPPASMTERQRAASKQLMPVVTALQKQSSHELSAGV